MLGSWFRTQPSDKRDNDEVKPPIEQIAPPVLQRQALSPITAEDQIYQPDPPDLKRTITAAISTPHDAVLAELQSQSQISPILKPLENETGVEELLSPTDSSGIALPNSPLLEHLCDPFSGAIVGTFAPTNDKQPQDTTATRDELWRQLGRIRELQSDMASMHAQMEGFGVRDRRGRTVERTGDRDAEEAEDLEAERKAEREAEFSKLPDKFIGRKDAIDKIMAKLDDLSKAVTTFHALNTPVVDLSNSRNNSVDNGKEEVSSPAPLAATMPLPIRPPHLSTTFSPESHPEITDSPATLHGGFQTDDGTA